jgi:chitinase
MRYRKAIIFLASPRWLHYVLAVPSATPSPDLCQFPCSTVGPDPQNWMEVPYNSPQDLSRCNQTILFTVDVENDYRSQDVHMVLKACVSTGKEEYNAPTKVQSTASGDLVQPSCGARLDQTKATPSVQPSIGNSSVSQTSIATAAEHLAHFYEKGASCGNNTLFAKSGNAVVGTYAGGDVQKDSAASILRKFEESTKSDNQALQVCGMNKSDSRTFGVFGSGIADLVSNIEAVKSWANGDCLNMSNTMEEIDYGVLHSPNEDPGTSVTVKSSQIGSNEHITSETDTSGAAGSTAIGQKVGTTTTSGTFISSTITSGTMTSNTITGGTVTGGTFSNGTLPQTFSNETLSTSLSRPFPNTTVSTTLSGPFSNATLSKNLSPTPFNTSTVNPGNGTAVIAGWNLTHTNSSAGINAGGSCRIYQVQPGDGCWAIANANGVTQDDMENNNHNTWGWAGCGHLQPNQRICLGPGDPPMPAAIDGTQCGPQVPGTQTPTNGTKLEDLNPCPLNACCSIWGYCGITDDFCIKHLADTGAPGTSTEQNGCAGSCGMAIVNNKIPPASFSRVAYFEAFSINRPCLNMDVTQVDPKNFTHIHFAFATLTPDFKVNITGLEDQFSKFQKLKGIKKILSFGGWAFSTDPLTYMIFRQATAPANRENTANNVVNFLKSNGIDGLDFDWEYPGEPDIAGIPPGGADEGQNYLGFLSLVRSKLPKGASLSIALPASYWYLKAFPVNDMQKYVDYFICKFAITAPQLIAGTTVSSSPKKTHANPLCRYDV